MKTTRKKQSTTAAYVDTMARLGVRLVHLGNDAGDASAGLTDLDGKFGTFMDGHGLSAMLVCPDFYLYGGAASPSDVPGLVARLAADLGRYGYRNAAPAASLAA